MSKKRVALLFGGASSEHEVSRLSLSCVYQNLPKDKYEPVLVGITKQGRWFLYTGNPDNIVDGSWEQDKNNRQAFLVPDASVHGLIVVNENSFETIRLDAVIPVLHGKNGEDGTMQGLLQLSGIPFVGCDTASSAVCMDKVFSNILLSYAGIPQAQFSWLYGVDYEKAPQNAIEKIERELSAYPMFVKPANAGSSVGVSKASNAQELKIAIERALKEDRKILVEEAIIGQEVECAVLGNDNPYASIVGEIAPSSDFYDYDDKYINGTSNLYIPAHLNEDTMQKIRDTAVKAYRLFGCSGLARVDFFVEKGKNRVLLNEINTLPGFTAISMYPKLMEACKIPCGDLIDRLITLGIERAEQA